MKLLFILNVPYLECIPAYQLAESIKSLTLVLIYNHDSDSHNCNKIMISNAIKRKAEVAEVSNPGIPER